MMKHTKHLLVLWAALLLGAGNAWGYTGTFELVESNNVPTGYYVITSSPSASTVKAMGTTLASGRATGQAVTISNKQIVNPADAIVWYIEKNADDTYSFKNVGDNNYIYQSSTTSGKGLAVSTSVPTVPWSINTYNSTSPIGFCFTSSKNSNNYLKWNNGSSWFSTYTSGYTASMAPVALYKLAGTTPTTDYSVHWNVDGQEWKTTKVTAGEAITTLPTAPSAPASCPDKVFMGWTANPSVNADGTGITYITAETVPDNDATYYAVFATETTTGSAFVLNSSGDFKMYAATGTNYYASGTGSKISSTTEEATATTYTFTALGNGQYTIQSGSTYITYSGSTNLGTSETAYTWTISAGTNGTWRIASGTSGRALVFRAGSTNQFGGYATSNVSASGTEYYDIEIDGGTTYSNYVTTCDECVPPATQLALTPAASSISLGEDGTATTTVAVSEGNGGTITYAISPASGATFNGTNFEATAAGSYTITATQAKSGNACAQSATTTITVTATPTINLVTTGPVEFNTQQCGTCTAVSNKKSVQISGWNLTPSGTVTATVTGPYKIASLSGATESEYGTEATLNVTSQGKTHATQNKIYIISCPPEKSTEATSGKLTFSSAGATPVEVILSTSTVTCPQQTLVFKDGATTLATYQGYGGDPVPSTAFPSDPEAPCSTPRAYEFAGWSETPITGEVTDNPVLFTKDDNYPMPATGGTLYAVYKYVDGGASTMTTDTYDWETTETGNWTVDADITRTSGQGTEGGCAGKINTATTHVKYNNKVLVQSFSFDFKRSSSNTNGTVYIETSEDGTNWTEAERFSMSDFNDGSYVPTKTHTFNVPQKVYVRFRCQQSTAIRYVDNVSITFINGTIKYTTSPICGPYLTITKGKDVYVTSGNVNGRKRVQAQDTVFYTAGSLKPSGSNAPSVKIPAADITVGGVPTTKVECTLGPQEVTGPVDGNYFITGYVVVKYNPEDFDKNEDINVQFRVNYNTGSDVSFDAFTVHARSLPEHFVIAAKNGTDGWVALPSSLLNSAAARPANFNLEVDILDNPTKATKAPCQTIFGFDGMKQGGDLRYVRFTGEGSAYLWASSGDGVGIKVAGSESTATSDSKPYNWLLKTTDNVTYQFANENNNRTLSFHNGKFGMYVDNNGVHDLRIIPVLLEDTCIYVEKPTELYAVNRRTTQVDLTWAPVPKATRYLYSANGTDWTEITTFDAAEPSVTITGLAANTEYTYYIRGAHGMGDITKICSDTAAITFTTTNCDDAPALTDGSVVSLDMGECGTIRFLGEVIATNNVDGCAITEYGIQYTQDANWATYETVPFTDMSALNNIDVTVEVSRAGRWYARVYATNAVGTSVGTAEFTDIAGLANLELITANDATTAPMIGGKATLRIGAATNSPAEVQWTVTDAFGASQPNIEQSLRETGLFTTRNYGVYVITATQAAVTGSDPYCAATASINIEVRKPNYYAYVTNCALLNNNNIEVLEVADNEIKFGFDDADMLQIEIVKENTGVNNNTGGSQATDLFFSKYYEATGGVKLVAIYNGTPNDIDVSNYEIRYGKTSWESGRIKIGNFTNQKNVIAAGEEVILYSKGNTSDDDNIMSCVNSKYPDGPWKLVTAANSGGSGLLSFAGDKTIALFNNGTLVDVIGVVKEDGNPSSSGIVGKTTQIDPNGVCWADASGWYCATGKSIKDGSVIGTSTNRCLLIRSNKVVSGEAAVANNKTNFSTLCDEWVGEHVPDTAADNGVQASCDNFGYIGVFDYAEYFNRYEPVTGKIDTSHVNMVHNADGSWSLSTDAFTGTAWAGKNFHDLACTSVKINGYKGDSITTSLNYKVPIIVDYTTDTDDADLFGFAGEGRLICPECDVVIRDNKKLSVVPAGYNNIRNMWVYSGAALNIQDDKTYNMGKLTIESENNEVGYALIKGTLNAQDGISHTKRIDANAWYDFSLPYNCKVSDIVRTNGKTLGLYSVNAGDLAKNDTARWVIKYYDGQKRANTGTPNGAAPTNWAVVPADGILEAGVGYIVALGGTHNANPNYKVRFVLPNRSTQPYVESVNDNRTKGVKGYTGPKAEELPCHKGWNYLGNPYVSRFDGNLQDPVWQTAYTGLLLNGFYTDLLTGNSYDVIEYPDLYVAVDMGEGGATNWVQTKASLALLSPFRAFMIQAVSDGDVDFNKEARNLPQGQAPSVRSVNTERETVSAVRLNIDHDTYGTGSTDIMLHSLYTDKYDLGYDMVRMFNSRPAAQPFTLNSTADYLLYNAANRDLAETADIPVGIRTLAAGTYTFSLAPLTGTDRYAAIYLIDRDENDLKIDLLQGNYTTMLARETNTSRFALRFEKGAQLPTDIDNDAIQSPIVYRDQTDIVIDNLPTDATVRVVDAIGRTLYMQQADAQIVRFHAPARGAYIIQVMTQQGNFSIKTIL